MTYPKRLIEVDLPIKRISAHARREKSIRHGHISTLHIWWARRPLAACRAVICASLWPDPADPNCPPAFRDAALKQMTAFSKATQSNKELSDICDADSWNRYKLLSTGKLIDPAKPKDLEKLRAYLLDFIADFAAWEASTNHWFLDTARSLTQAAHEALGGEKGTRPLVVDPFAGGGSIPLEALRVGADAFASDLNPIPVLLNKVVLEYVPKYGQRLADEVRKRGQWVKERARKELAAFYPNDADGAIPIAYLWARTVRCEGPSCGAEIPLIRSLWLARSASRSVMLQIVPNPRMKRVDFEIIQDAKSMRVGEGTVRRGSATCPCCGYTTPVASVRTQLTDQQGGAGSARLFAVVTLPKEDVGRCYRLATEEDAKVVNSVGRALRAAEATKWHELSIIPDEVIPNTELRRISVPLYGMKTWGDLYSPRQLLCITTYVRLVHDVRHGILNESGDELLAEAVATVLGLAVSRLADICNALCMWETSKTQVRHAFTRQALGMLWDFAEPNVLADAAGNFDVTLATMMEVLEREAAQGCQPGKVEQASATAHPLPDKSADAVVTDPPYYDAVPYSHLSDFFYVWLRRVLANTHPSLFKEQAVPKAREVVVDRPHKLSSSTKDVRYYEQALLDAFTEARRVAKPSAVSTIVFASKTTASWEAVLSAVINGGWIISASWPIDTELENRLAAQGQARLASSIHLVCRPRQDSDDRTQKDEIGDWRDVLAELPKRTRIWMKRLAEEGVVGADAIFACLGPALEIFSRYSHVEKASGERVLLKEYLTYVWGAVAQEALGQIFKGADATGFEEDARLTAMWLWTLNAGAGASEQADGEADADSEETPDAGEEEASSGGGKAGGYVLEFDAARKIAQGLGAHLEDLTSVIEVKGDKARLLSVGERTHRLFGKDEAEAPQPKRKKKDKQMKLFSLEEVESEEGGWGEKSVPKLGNTVLDRVHQSMILFAAGRGEAMRRFLVEDGAGQDQRFWKLANALSALYPQGTEEKRWVDGVLARKKGLGL